MRSERETPAIERCWNPGHQSIEHQDFWQAKGSLGTGLRAAVVVAADTPVFRVFTGGLLSKHFVPTGSNSPLQVDGIYTLEGDSFVETMLSTSYVFGPRVAVAEELRDVARLQIREFLDAIVSTAPTFQARWDEVAAQAVAGATKRAETAAATSVEHVAERLATSISDVLASVSTGTPIGITEIIHAPYVLELAATVATAPAAVEVPAATGQQATDVVSARLAADADAALAAHTRLSELEFINLVVQKMRAELGASVDEWVIRRIVTKAYDWMYDVYYTTGNFPDRAAVPMPRA